MKNQIRVVMILLLSFVVLGCSVFRSTTQTVNYSCSEPGAKLYINGEEHDTPFEGKMPRNKSVIIECKKEGYQYASRLVKTKLNATGVLDTIGGYIIFLPYIGVFTPGAYSLDERSVEVSMFPETSKEDKKDKLQPQPASSSFVADVKSETRNGESKENSRKGYRASYTFTEFLRLNAFEAEVVGIVDIPGPPTFAPAALCGSDKHVVLKSKVGETILIDRVPTSVSGTYCGTLNSAFPIKVGDTCTFPAVLQPRSDCVDIQ